MWEKHFLFRFFKTLISCKGLSKNYVVLGVGRWVKVKTLRLHYVRGEGGGIGRKHYEKHYVFFSFLSLLFLQFLIYVRIFLVCLCLCVLLTFLHFIFCFYKKTFFAILFEFFMPKRKYVVKCKEFEKRFKAVDIR